MTMAIITIKLAPSDVLRDFITYGKKADLMVGAKLEAGKYTIMPSFEVYADGEDAAEAVFDLTNNPSRQREREDRYGRHRSISVGDVVEVDGVDYLCDSFGWTELEIFFGDMA